MQDEWLARVGQRIRLYRRSLGLTTQDLARLVGKSKASVSKYEAGLIAIDILTLNRIAGALGLDPSQLLDHTRPPAGEAGPGRNPFGDARQLYLYHLSAGRVYGSSLELHGGTAQATRATLFYKCDSPSEARRCECIYHGEMRVFDFVLSLQLQNHNNPAEQVLLNIRVPLQQASLLTGMLSGLGGNTLLPTAHKVIVGRAPLPVDDELRSLLTIPADSFREMKRKNTLFVPLE